MLLPDIPDYGIPVLVLAGVAGGFLNTVASSGTAITLPALIALGHMATLANGTNRVPVMIGFAVAVWKFHRAGELPWREGFRFTLPLIIGAVAGALLALKIGDQRTGFVLTCAVVIAACVVLSRPSRWLKADQIIRPVNFGPLVIGVLVMVGFWTGLIVIDSGIYFLASLLLLAHLPLRVANSIKALGIGTASIISVVIFASKGEVDWPCAMIVSVGSVVGSLIGVRVALSEYAARWVFGSLVFVLSLESIILAHKFL
jgi:uncharacterized membrane protein YfcA